MKYNEQIHNRALQEIARREELAEYIRDCITADICPKCGEGLSNKSAAALTTYKCAACSYEYTE